MSDKLDVRPFGIIDCSPENFGKVINENTRLRAELAEKDALVASAKRIMRQLYGNMPDGVEVDVGEWLHEAGKEGKE